jgi:hypothetical protein
MLVEMKSAAPSIEPRRRGRKDAVGADDAALVLVAHDQVVAVGVVDVAIDTGGSAVQARAHFRGENAVAQLLRFQNFGFAGREPDMQVAAGTAASFFLFE